MSPNKWDEGRFRTSEDQFLQEPIGAREASADARHDVEGSTARRWERSPVPSRRSPAQFVENSTAEKGSP